MDNSYIKSTKIAYVMLGINDILRHQNIKDIINYYEKILIHLSDKNIRCIVLSTLYIDSELKGHKSINEKVWRLNKHMQIFSRMNSLKYIDLNNRMASNNKELKQEYTYDGIHLNTFGYLKVKAILIEDEAFNL